MTSRKRTGEETKLRWKVILKLGVIRPTWSWQLFKDLYSGLTRLYQDRMFIILQLRKLPCWLCINEVKKKYWKSSDGVCPCLRVTLSLQTDPWCLYLIPPVLDPYLLLIKKLVAPFFSSDVFQQLYLIISISIYLGNLDFSGHWSPLNQTTNKRTLFLSEALSLHFGCWTLNHIAILPQ